MSLPVLIEILNLIEAPVIQSIISVEISRDHLIKTRLICPISEIRLDFGARVAILLLRAQLA